MGSKLQQVFEQGELYEYGVEPLPHWMCCVSCGHAQAEEALEEEDCFVFFTAQDTENAAACGHLWLAYGCVGGDEEDVQMAGRMACDALREMGLEAEWSGEVTECICVTVGEEDRAWLQALLDADQREADALWEEEMEEDARAFRLSRLLDAWRRGKFTRRVAGKRIAEAFVDFGARPGGVLYKRARARFNGDASSLQ